MSKERRQSIHRWLNEKFRFTHFITLASNSSGISTEVMKDRLKHWDQRVNRQLYGPKWRKHYDELLWYFAFLEKPEINPHWHLLCRFQDDDKQSRLQPAATVMWRKMMPQGTVDVQVIRKTQPRVVDYVVKCVGYDLEYTNFIAPDEFRRT